MVWLLSILAVFLVGRASIWLYAIHNTIKKQSRMRVEMHVGDASEYAEIDGFDLQPLTDELQKLGFVALGDLLSEMSYEPLPSSPGQPSSTAPVPEAETIIKGVARIFAHPMHGCYANVSSVVAVSRFPPEMKRADRIRVSPFRTVIMSMDGTEDDSWSFSTHNRELDPYLLRQRHPRALGRCLVGASVRQLLEAHLTERDSIAARGRIEWDKETSFAKHQAFGMKALRHIRRLNERTTTLGFAWHLLTYRLRTHGLWLGELA